MIKPRIIFFSGILLTVLTSCYEDVFEIDLHDLQSQIVIEGIVSDIPGFTHVKLSTTSSLFQEDSIKQVRGAIVNISDSEGNSEILNEVAPGIYYAQNIIGSPGTIYYLSVLAKGREYFAVSKFPYAIELDSVNLIRRESWRTTYRLNAYFNEHPGIEEYCLINFYQNGEHLWWNQILYNDRFRDGMKIKLENLNTDFFLFDNIKIEVLTFNRTIYNYYSVMLETDEDSGDQSLIDLASANPPSNINNNALGYFSAQAYRIYNITIRE